MKHLKLFFALFAMFALGVGNAWGEESLQVTLDFTTNSWNLPTSKVVDELSFTSGSYTIKVKGTTGNGYQFNSQKYLIMGKSGATLTLPAFDFNTTKIVVTGKSGASGSVKQNIYVGSNAVSTETTGASGTNTYTINAANQAAGNVYILKVTSAHNTQITKIEVYGESNSTEPPTPATQYTIKWHTDKGVTTDVTLNEDATITEPETDPTMTGYKFMGWTASCDVASDGSDFTALTDFGTADSDKDFYAVFAVATTTGGGGTTTETLKGSDVTYSSTSSGYKSFTATTASGTWTGTANYNTQGYIQINKNSNNYHIGSPTFASNVTSIKITTTNNSAANRTFYICSSNSTAQPSSGNLGSHNTTVVNESFTIDLTTDAKQFYIYSSGAVYISQIDVTYSGGGTTTYDSYITTCASGIEYVELGDDFKWSATEAEVTIDATDNVFPTLTNTHNVPVTYSCSDETIATIVDGAVTLKKEGTVTITAKYAGGTSAGTGKEYKAKTVTYSLKVNKAAPVASGTTYVKVTSTAGITDGEYLIVYEEGKVAFNGALIDLDAVGNTIEVTINNNTIAGTNYIDAATFTIDVTNGTILSASGKYIGKTANSNGLDVKTTAMTNTFAFDANGNAVITGGNTAALRYNKAADQKRFRYYKDGGGSQEKIALYKKASSHTLTYGTCTNGSVSADVADGATVLSGTTITLSNTPATNYKLTAYNVYKTGEESTKVTVADDNTFIMPEFDVTISATFEAAKTLNSIEITTSATQTTFWQGETFNYTGLEVTAHFDGAADEVVTPTVTGSTATAGTQTVTVSYTEGTTTKTATYTITVKAIPNTKETAYTVAEAYDIIGKLETASGVFISGIISQVDSYNSTYKSITYWISADGTTTKQLQVYSGKGLESADFTAVTDVAKGAQVIVCGNLKKHNTTYEFDYNNYLAAYTAPTKAEPGITYATTEYTANVNEEFTAPTLTNPNDLTVTYKSSDETLATVNATTGEVTILNKTGKVTITATFAGNETYLYGTASYNITISDPSLLEATFDATVDLGNTERGEGEITKSPITFACTDGVLGNASEYRLYQNATISFTAENGYAITKVVITSTASGTSQYGPGLLSTENGTYSVSDKTGTWVGEAQTVTFTATAQSRAKLITVYYKTDNRQDAGLVWSTENVSITLGDACTPPTLSNPNGLTLTCTSDNENLATVTNAGVVTLKSGVTGTATITAKFDGNSNYKDATVTCTITVNPKTEIVVILAQYNGQWYALKNVEETAGKVLAALPVNYVGGKLYNVEEADKATIEWQRAAVTDGIIFKNGENYIYGTAGSTDLKLSTTECAWTLDGSTYKIGNRTFFYNETANGFKNYNTSNAGNSGYSNLPVVTAPVYATGDAYGRSVNLGEDGYRYGTICLPFGSTNFTGAEFFECVGKEEGKVYLGSVTTLVAGTPYIFLASATEVAVYGDGTTAATPGSKNGLVGTFTNDTEVAIDNYILKDNAICKVAATCWVNAYRAYIVMEDVPTGVPQQMPGRRYIGMSVQGENETTGFDNIQLPNANSQKLIINGQLIIIRDGEMYNAQGQKL